ncbi:uncharacterized protein LOC143446940 isoform X2 [Clavelina lepadiformis]|uniref:uncharacterized protein LOC143446940 isoform X2 n=1 Tax=Clavelina lepadiformis TaxID=159417 RepID=UPI0040422EDD
MIFKTWLCLLFLLRVTSSEKNSNCSISNAFYCSDGGCIESKYFCDFHPDCSDGSDEIPFNETIHGEKDGISCIVKRKRGSSGRDAPVRACLLTPEHVCNHELNCFFGEDESTCSHTYQCQKLPYPYTIYAEKQYKVRVQFCDNKQDCLDGSDEMKYSPGARGFQCAVTKTRITTKCLLPTTYVCDGVADCDDGTDECRCGMQKEGFIYDRCFQCFDESLVVPRKKVCDGIFDCPDLSDECLCSMKKNSICDQLCKVGQDCGECQVGQIMCLRTNASLPVVCLNRTNMCDQHFDCPDGEDERNCNIDEMQIFKCTDERSYIQLYRRCDNHNDCEDGSDEIGCNNLHECHPYLRNRDGTYNFATPRFTTKCDKIPDCAGLDDECNQSICTNGSLPAFCSHVEANGFICPNSRSSIIGKEICDGFPTCNDTSPPDSADEFDCENRFYCNDSGAVSLPIHIPIADKCNAITDCYDVSDEIGCDNTTHFYCKTGLPIYIPKRKVCDGIQDCLDGEDECQGCAASPFSSDAFVIHSYALQVFVWIFGIFSAFGNLGVLIHNILQLLRDRAKMSSLAVNHRILLVNLALADLLFGIYLLSLAVTNAVYSGSYCRQDIQWRASTTCNALGVIAVISIESSILLLSVMATNRLLIVLKPFKTRVKKRYVFLSLFFTWTFSITLATVPLSQYQEDYFVSSVWYRSNSFLTIVNRNEMESFVTKLLSLQDPLNLVFFNNSYSDWKPTWETMFAVVSHLNPSYTPEHLYGYYSAHGVCLPRLYADPSSDRSWGFTLFLIILDFCLFIWILGAYIAISRVSRSRGKQAGRNMRESSNHLERKITRIIITNFLCWIPICIMAFVKFGGGYVSDEAYAVSAIILLPINPAFNPFLYSHLPDLIWEALLPVRKRFASTKCGKWCHESMGKAMSMRSRRERSRATTKTSAGRKQNQESFLVKHRKGSPTRLRKCLVNLIRPVIQRLPTRKP